MFVGGVIFLAASLAVLVWAIATAFDDRDERRLEATAHDATPDVHGHDEESAVRPLS